MGVKHLTPAELAERLDIPVRTLDDWRYRGIGPRSMRVGRHIRYRLGDVEAWEQSRLAESTSGGGDAA